MEYYFNSSLFFRPEDPESLNMKGSVLTKNHEVKLEKGQVFYRKYTINIYLCTILKKYKILKESHYFLFW